MCPSLMISFKSRSSNSPLVYCILAKGSQMISVACHKLLVYKDVHQNMHIAANKACWRSCRCKLTWLSCFWCWWHRPLWDTTSCHLASRAAAALSWRRRQQIQTHLHKQHVQSQPSSMAGFAAITSAWRPFSAGVMSAYTSNLPVGNGASAACASPAPLPCCTCVIALYLTINCWGHSIAMQHAQQACIGPANVFASRSVLACSGHTCFNNQAGKWCLT